ncbi:MULTISPECIES: glucosidase [unclassified Leptolyngbya]|uniref:MGH1-like glycoside hydrolase domain-containing protein n=1 Tax=unclassified Leptolyngbya TaxID=2650499 RepID=UPI001684FC46|nr:MULTISPECIES: glucosidase [unclassified Leptolyngbya]MBD1913151.1 glucosidase [Leptolyngbya sp. FACHB-8]MBD2158810.1 glucosidase [Leptolyngbya sp. FACHB-16]
MTQEEARLAADRERTAYWKRWGPYLSERQWGTVREDYSTNGTAWEYFPHDHARSRAYRWGEDGIAGISDTHQRLCFAIALWNGEDPILKERLFGLTGNEGNHGEDVKEYYFYLDNTPTHSYMKYLYKYPHRAFPYTQLVEENRRRSRQDFEFELLDTGIFESNNYFDVFVEYAKASSEDILIQINVINRGTEIRTLHLLPTLWFRNTWAWGFEKEEKPWLAVSQTTDHLSVIEAFHPTLGRRWFYCEDIPNLLFTNNETNYERLFEVSNASSYVKDGINDYVIHNHKDAINPSQTGTKFSAHYQLAIAPGAMQTVRLRLRDSYSDPSNSRTELFGQEFGATFRNRQQEADEFYQRISPSSQSEEMQNIQRQAFAGMLWNKQFYHYVIHDWLHGDPTNPAPPERKYGRNHEWTHLYNDDVLSMPDKWEYPWFAAWDLAFHCIPLTLLDPEFAKRQLSVLTREWYMHPNGQLPAYEWAFSDVNPPVHAWAALQIYEIEQKMYGRSDRPFLERVFQKLLLNFTWWVNRKDIEGKNVFQGGFLGLDNIGVFDRSASLPDGGYINQADGTSWMGMYCLNMLEIALELAKEDSTYEDVASKFFEHFLYIADAIDGVGEAELSLWDETDGFYYDALHLPDGQHFLMKVRSVVGLAPLFAVTTLEPETLNQFPGFRKRTAWFMQNRPDLTRKAICLETRGGQSRSLLAIAGQHQLRRILQKMLDEAEFLAPYGIRSLSKFHASNPYVLQIHGNEYRVDYEPAESTTGVFGGNSNWRGPVWFPMNYLVIESLQKYYHYLGDEFKVECPTGSGQMMTLWQVAAELSQRLLRTFLNDVNGERPIYGGTETFQTDPHWHDLVLFYEYFHGDNGAGIGASHQTGWTGLVAKLIHQYAKHGENPTA